MRLASYNVFPFFFQVRATSMNETKLLLFYICFMGKWSFFVFQKKMSAKFKSNIFYFVWPFSGWWSTFTCFIFFYFFENGFSSRVYIYSIRHLFYLSSFLRWDFSFPVQKKNCLFFFYILLSKEKYKSYEQHEGNIFIISHIGLE